MRELKVTNSVEKILQKFICQMYRPGNFLNLLDTWAFNPKPTAFCSKVKKFEKFQNLHIKDKSRKIMQQNVMILYHCKLEKPCN